MTTRLLCASPLPVCPAQRGPRRLGLAALLLSLCSAGVTHAEGALEKQRVSYALIVGVNQSAEPDLLPLKYADDDAVRYQEMFSTLGAQTFLLTAPDENTRRLHPDAAAAAQPPTLAALRATVDRIAALAGQERQRGNTVNLYVLYAGHGKRDESSGRGFLTLADARLSAAQLQKLIVARIPAHEFHVIVDACNADFLAAERGAGGTRRRLSSFVTEVATEARDPRVGLLYATSSMAKTFEYDGFQAGVFSHLVRSGLYGAADFDHDGSISYDEILRFVTHATAPVPNEKYRPAIVALRPTVTRSILDIRAGLARGRLEIDATVHSAHHMVEDNNGVRLLDFHNGAGAAVHLVMPAGATPLSLIREIPDSGMSREEEVEISPGQEVVLVAALSPQERTITSRGAADSAFRKLFSAPFDATALGAISVQSQDVFAVIDQAERQADSDRRSRLRFWSKASLATGALAAIAGAGALLLAKGTADGASASDDQMQVAARNLSIERWQLASGIGFSLAGTALVSGVVLHFLSSPPNGAASSGSGGDVAWRERF